MDLEAFCRQSNVVVVVGKGGVGKTTITAALAKLGARTGLDVLIVSLDDAGHIERLFEKEVTLTNNEVVLVNGSASQTSRSNSDARVPGRIRARLITAEVALADYLAEKGLGGIARRIVDAGALDVVATTAPGVRELLILSKIKQLERDRVADLIVLDAPATGHALTFLASPSGLADASRGGPLRAQADQVVEFLRNESRCQVLLVTIPEETPVNEVVETAYRLEDTLYVALAPVVVNGCYETLNGLDIEPTDAAQQAGINDLSVEDRNRIAATASFRKARQELQGEQVERLSNELPLRQLRLPYVFAPEIGHDQIELLTDAFAEAVDQL